MSFLNAFFRGATIRNLAHLDDDRLMDIGLHRADIEQAARMGRGAANYLQQQRALRTGA